MINRMTFQAWNEIEKPLNVDFEANINDIVILVNSRLWMVLTPPVNNITIFSDSKKATPKDVIEGIFYFIDYFNIDAFTIKHKPNKYGLIFSHLDFLAEWDEDSQERVTHILVTDKNKKNLGELYEHLA